eukprot:g918.t1
MSEQDDQLRAVEEARAMMGESMVSQGSQNPLERSLELSTGGGLAASSTTPAAAAKSDSRPKTYRQRLKPDGTKMSLAEIRAQEVAEEEAEEEAEYQKQLAAKRAKQADIDAAKQAREEAKKPWEDPNRLKPPSLSRNIGIKVVSRLKAAVATGDAPPARNIVLEQSQRKEQLASLRRQESDLSATGGSGTTEMSNTGGGAMAGLGSKFRRSASGLSVGSRKSSLSEGDSDSESSDSAGASSVDDEALPLHLRKAAAVNTGPQQTAEQYRKEHLAGLGEKRDDEQSSYESSSYESTSDDSEDLAMMFQQSQKAQDVLDWPPPGYQMFRKSVFLTLLKMLGGFFVSYYGLVLFGLIYSLLLQSDNFTLIKKQIAAKYEGECYEKVQLPIELARKQLYQARNYINLLLDNDMVEFTNLFQTKDTLTAFVWMETATAGHVRTFNGADRMRRVRVDQVATGVLPRRVFANYTNGWEWGQEWKWWANVDGFRGPTPVYVFYENLQLYGLTQVAIDFDSVAIEDELFETINGFDMNVEDFPISIHMYAGGRVFGSVGTAPLAKGSTARPAGCVYNDDRSFIEICVEETGHWFGTTFLFVMQVLIGLVLLIPLGLTGYLVRIRKRWVSHAPNLPHRSEEQRKAALDKLDQMAKLKERLGSSQGHGSAALGASGTSWAGRGEDQTLDMSQSFKMVLESASVGSDARGSAAGLGQTGMSQMSSSRMSGATSNFTEKLRSLNITRLRDAWDFALLLATFRGKMQASRYVDTTGQGGQGGPPAGPLMSRVNGVVSSVRLSLFGEPIDKNIRLQIEAERAERRKLEQAKENSMSGTQEGPKNFRRSGTMLTTSKTSPSNSRRGSET